MQLKIERLGIHGEGIGYADGYTIFVDGALPGELVEVDLFQKKKTYGRAKLTNIITPSLHRVTPTCPLFNRCGGCQLMHLAYQQQLELKQQRVVDALERIGKFKNLKVNPCLPSPDPLHYRNKTQMHVRPTGIGFNARSSHDLVDVDHCFIHCELGQKIYDHLKPLAATLAPYDWKTKKGYLRYLIIKSAVYNNEVLVVMVTNSKDDAPLIPLARTLMASCPEVKGVIQNINVKSHNVVLGKDNRVIAGQAQIQETLCNLTFNISATSFFQVNTPQAEHLYNTALSFAEITQNDVVLDAFCGVGTLSLICAKQAQKVIGVEIVKEAIEDAKENARINNIANVNFLCDEVERRIHTLETLDVVLLNPPRKGCEPSFLHELGKRKPKRIVYISCDPATLARDLAILNDLDFTIETVQPLDMFPQTAHVETVVRISGG